MSNAESLVYQLELQNHEPFTELRNTFTHLAQQYSKDLNGFELSGLQGHRHFPQKSKTERGKLDFSPKGLLKYISSMGLEAYKSLATALQILLT
jgi:hypothetical protein